MIFLLQRTSCTNDAIEIKLLLPLIIIIIIDVSWFWLSLE